MSEREKQIAENLAEAVAKLPDSKREFLLGYAANLSGSIKKDAAVGGGAGIQSHDVFGHKCAFSL